MSTAEPAAPRLSVCLVNWNTCEHLRRCLASLRRESEGQGLHVVVVDNASADGSVEMVRAEFPEALLLANPDNRGYAAGNNQALQAATGTHKLLLNPDVEVHPGALETLLACLEEHPGAGAVAPRLRYPDGRVQLTCRSFPTPDTVLYEALLLSRLWPRSRRFGKWRMSWWGHDDERAVDQPMASALLLRGEALAEVGLLDEQFPIFFNDVDLCYRLRQAGWEVWFTPRAEMTHYHGAATAQRWARMLNESHRGFVRFYRKHYRGRINPGGYALALSLLAVGFAVRRLLLWLSGRGGPYRAAGIAAAKEGGSECGR